MERNFEIVDVVVDEEEWDLDEIIEGYGGCVGGNGGVMGSCGDGWLCGNVMWEMCERGVFEDWLRGGEEKFFNNSLSTQGRGDELVVLFRSRKE